MDESVEIQLFPNSRSLYVFFGGISSGIAIPPFEFYNASKIIDANKIFIRDFSQSWYQNGLPGVGRNIFSIVDYIQNKIKKINPEKVFFVGNSMGGYAAIAFSCLIGFGEAIAFAPQTFISPILRLSHKDDRWKRQIGLAYRRSLFKRKVWDLKPLLIRSNGSNKVSIFVSKTDRLDLVHANHIAGLHGVNVYEFDGGGHDIVKLLRDEGKLAEIMSGVYVH